jgi:hypothetical protein
MTAAAIATMATVEAATTTRPFYLHCLGAKRRRLRGKYPACAQSSRSVSNDEVRDGKGEALEGGFRASLFKPGCVLVIAIDGPS